MTVTLQLNRGTEALLIAQAKAKGVALDAYLYSILEAIAKSPASSQPMTPESRAAAFEDANPPDEALRRENLYPDRW